MKILVKSVNLELDRKAREHVESRLHSSLGHLANRILRVAVRIRDLNGPRGGEDINCLVEIRLRPRGRLFIEETDVDLPGAVGRAAEASVTAVRRSLEKSRDSHRRARAARLFGSSDGHGNAGQSFA